MGFYNWRKKGGSRGGALQLNLQGELLSFFSLSSGNDTAAEDRLQEGKAWPAWETEKISQQTDLMARLLRGWERGDRGVSAGENKANCYLSQPEESWEHFKTKQAVMTQLLLLRVS